MSEQVESTTPQKTFNSQKVKIVPNHAYTPNFPGIEANTFEDDFFNMADIPGVFNTQAKILEYELLEIFGLKVLYNQAGEASQTWRQTSFLELCRNGDLEKLVIQTNGGFPPIFADGIFEKLRKLADDIDSFNKTKPQIEAIRIIDKENK